MNNLSEPLKILIDRIDAIMDDIEGRKEELRELYASAKSDGYDVPALRVVVKQWRETVDRRQKREAIEESIDLYRHALGMLDGTPLGEAAIERVE